MQYLCFGFLRVCLCNPESPEAFYEDQAGLNSEIHLPLPLQCGVKACDTMPSSNAFLTLRV